MWDCYLIFAYCKPTAITKKREGCKIMLDRRYVAAGSFNTNASGASLFNFPKNEGVRSLVGQVQQTGVKGAATS